jgi:T5SS/PEP-CTERM-associated repeat protein
VPGTSDSVIFDRTAAYTVDFEEDHQSETVSVAAGDVTFLFGHSKYEVGEVSVAGEGGETASLLVTTNNIVITEEHGVLADEIYVGQGGALSNGLQLFVGNIDFPPFGPYTNQTDTDLQAKRALLVEGGGSLRSPRAKVDGPANDDGSGIATARITGTGSKWEVATLTVGEQAAGKVEITDGGRVFSPDVGTEALSIVVDSIDSTAESSLLVSGFGVQDAEIVPSAVLAADITVGDKGNGRLDVENRGLLGVDILRLGNDNGVVGRAFVRGEGTLLRGANEAEGRIVVANGGRGDLTVSQGAKVEAFLTIGQSSIHSEFDDEGIVTVSGLGTQLVSPQINVGVVGKGELVVADQAHVEASIVELGRFADSTGVIRVSGAGTEFTTLVTLSIGGGDFIGRGEVRVSEDAVVNVKDADEAFGNVRIGHRGLLELASGGKLHTVNVESGDGEIIVRDAQSHLTSNFGLGTSGEFLVSSGSVTVKEEPLTLRAGSQASVTDGGIIKTARADVSFNAELLVTGAGSMLKLDESLSTGPASDETFEAAEARVAGKLTVSAAGRVEANRIVVGVTGRVDGDGGVIAVGRQLVADGGFFNQGLVAEGASPGVLTIQGDFANLETGVIEIEIAGSNAGTQHDQLIIEGNAIFGGTVVFEFIDGFAPTQGEVFDFLAVSGETDLSGAAFEVRNLAPGFQFDIMPTSAGFQMVALNNGTFVPEPGTLVLVSLCLLGVLCFRNAR